MGRAPERRYVPLLIAALGVLFTAGALGSAFAPMLAVEAPLVLIALSPLGRHLVLVVPETSMPAFVAVGASRRLLAFAIIYFLARAYGEDGLVWIEGRYARFGKFVRLFERAFRKAAPLLVLLLPGMSAPIAGATRMPPRVYFPLAALAVTGWVSVTYVVGDALSEWITPVLAFIRANVFETTAVCAVVVLLYEWRRRAKARVQPLPAPD